MKVFNTLVPVVALVEAETDEAALRVLTSKLEAAGFEAYAGGPFDAFESEALPDNTEVLRA